jgi:DNA-binding HxlR family transcriptional regulator
MLQITATTDEDQELCPIRNVLANVTGKWQLLIVFSLEDEPKRFSAIKRIVGDITQRVLTENLRSLERDGYVRRTVHPGPPVEVSYALTDLGQSLLHVLKQLAEWAAASYPAVRSARIEYDERGG